MKEPIMIDDVEVVNIDPVHRSFRLHVHLAGITPQQLFEEKVQDYVYHRIDCAVNYLVQEGFIPDPRVQVWHCLLVGIAHPELKIKNIKL
jgi:hypothetical protein